MMAAGYTADVHRQGWTLLRACGGFPTGAAVDNSPGGVAIRSLSDWCVHSFPRIEAALTHLHPEQEAYVFQSLAPVSGPSAVVAVELFLERLEDLAGTGPHADARKATADADKAALATLASRGFDDKELNRVHALVTVAQTATPTPVDAQTQDATKSQTEALTELKAWYDDWAKTAHEVILKRGDLIKVGLARPRKAKASDTAASLAPAATTTPAATESATTAGTAPTHPAGGSSAKPTAASAGSTPATRSA